MTLLSDRFKPDNIADPMVRARLYRDIRCGRPRGDAGSWTDRVIAPGERLFPELLALRVYGDHRLKWVVLAAAAMDDYRLPLESGETLKLPSIEWLRDRFRHYEKLSEVDPEPAPVLARARESGAPIFDIVDQSNEQTIRALKAAVEVLGEPIPALSTADEITDETLNQQANDIADKLTAMRGALANLLELKQDEATGADGDYGEVVGAVEDKLQAVREALAALEST